MSLLSKITLAAGIALAPLVQAVAIAPKLQVEDWVQIGTGAYYSVEIDGNSLNVNVVDGGWQIFARLRTKYFQEVKLKGKKPGAYAISDTIAICKEDTFVVSTSTLYDKDGAEIETVRLRAIPNPHEAANFVSVYLDLMCNNAKNYKPPLTT
jgi:hypothetical protein